MSFIKKLFAPVELYLKNKDVIIIPDGAIFYVPFEALITKPVNSIKPLIIIPYLF